MRAAQPLIDLFPDLERRRIPLLPGATPVHELRRLSEDLSQPIWVKREDLTDTSGRYGGNKVRNLEFILGDAIARRKRGVWTVAPYGSNFVAALAAQSSRIGLRSEVFHFHGPKNAQTDAHARYSREMGTKLRVSRSSFGESLMPSLISSYSAAGARWALGHHANGAYIAEGGSSPLGALGHAGAYLELAGQIERGECPRPDVIVVGVGTCGNLAGLLAGRALSSLRLPILGVRTVPALICNRRKVARLATATLARLGITRVVLPHEVWLESASSTRYGWADHAALRAKARLQDLEGLTLDTTYTSKVAAHLSAGVESGRFKELGLRQILYWHTYSAVAIERKGLRSRKNSGCAGLRLGGEPTPFPLAPSI